jgi:hypothetical protein
MAAKKRVKAINVMVSVVGGLYCKSKSLRCNKENGKTKLVRKGRKYSASAAVQPSR